VIKLQHRLLHPNDPYQKEFRATLHDYLHKNINTTKKPLIKKCWNVGNNTVVVIDKTLVERLAITEDNTFFEEELTDGGILLRIKKSV
jgi:hypothetical protein